MTPDPIQILKQLVAIPSVNPMGRDLSGTEFFEHRLTDYLEQFFDRLGLKWQRQTIAPRRDNILARLDGQPPHDSGGQLIMFEAHQDTVPVDNMTIPPWDPVEREGKVYGRGSCDVKGGLAAMLAAFARLAEERPAGMPTIIMASTVNEEHGFSGAKGLCRLFADSQTSLLPRKPDAVVVAEPTQLDVVIAHKGAIRWRCQTKGRAAHSSQPELGDNAIYKMGRVLAALEVYQREIAPTLGQHRLCGRPALSVGTIRGGLSVNTVPDACTIEIDRRLLPGEDPEAAYRHVIEFIEAQRLGFKPEHQLPFLQSSGLSDDHNRQLADRLTTITARVAGRAKLVGVPYGTNASAFAAAGIPSVVFGPGSIEQAHTSDEWIALEQVVLASEVYYQFGRSGL